MSRACVPCIQFIQQYNIPVKIVRLDTVETRKAALNGKHFQIKNVPTLLVSYQDGNLQFFAGQEKVIMWLQKSIQPPQEQTHTEIQSTDLDLDLQDSSDEESSPQKKKHKKKKEKNLYGGSRHKKSKSKKRRPKSPPKPILKEYSEEEYSDEEYEDVPIEFIDDGSRPNRPQGPPTDGLMVGAQAKQAPGRMNNVMQLAQQMRMDRKNTLGYDEKDLPH